MAQAWRTVFNPMYARHSEHDGKINVWGCFAYSGVGHLFHIHRLLDQQKYRQILIHHMKPNVRDLFNGNNCIFQQDNDPKHTAKTVKAYLPFSFYTNTMAISITRLEPNRESMFSIQPQSVVLTSYLGALTTSHEPVT